MKFLRVVAWLLMISCTAVAWSASVKFANLEDDTIFCKHLGDVRGCVVLLVEGPIEVGDAQNIEHLMNYIVESLASLDYPVRVGKIHFNSPGGSLSEGMKIGRLLRENLVAAQVTEDSECHSACVIAFLGAVARISIGPVGIHTFYSRDLFGATDYAMAKSDFESATRSVREYLLEMRIPASFLDEMFKVPPESVNILSFEERERLGVIGVDPLYRQLVKDKPD